MAEHIRTQDRRRAAWIFGGVSFCLLLYIILFGPEELSPVKKQALGIVCALLCGCFGFFFTGSIKLVSQGEICKLGKVSIQAGGGIALFIFVMLWWNSGVGPVREIKEDIHSIKQNTEDIKASMERLAVLQKISASGSELLAEFRQGLEMANFSARELKQDDRIAAVLDNVARNHGITLDELRQKILNAASGAKERVELADKCRRASASEARRMMQIERDGYADLGTAALSGQQFAKAREFYNQALLLTSKETEDRIWAMLNFFIGWSSEELGICATNSSQYLSDAVNSYQDALSVYSREKSPEYWAWIKNNLGNALRAQAERSQAKDATLLLHQAELVYRDALLVYTQTNFPLGWALVQNNLGATLQNQAGLFEGEQSFQMLSQAAFAYMEALKVRTREKYPEAWAMTLSNFANTLCDLADRSEGGQAAMLLNAAIDAYRDVLQVRTREQYPEGWATTQNNLGTALLARSIWAERTNSVQLLVQALDAYHEALTVRVPEKYPQAWAMTQDNLGGALMSLAEQSEASKRNQLLDEAVGAFHDALTVYTRDQMPQDWAKVEINLGTALTDQASSTNQMRAAQLSQEAVVALQNALTIFTEAFPLQHKLAIQSLERAKGIRDKIDQH